MKHRKPNVAENDGSYIVKKNKRMNVLAFIGCVVLAFVIWIYVMNVKMSDNIKTFSTTLDIKNHTEYSVFGAQPSVRVTVQGTKAELQKYTEKDFKVYVEILSIDETGMVPLNVIVDTPSASINVVSVDPIVATLMVDEKEQKDVPLTAVLSDSEQQVSLELNESNISVVGPKSYLDKIVSAKIIVNASSSDVGKEIKSHSDIWFYDETDTAVASAYLVYDASDITVTVCEREAAEQ